MDVRFENEALNKVFQAELAAGNRIVEQTNWPPKCQKLVILEFRFSRHYDFEGLHYREVSDPHYWFSEYGVASGKEVLACRYKTLRGNAEK